MISCLRQEHHENVLNIVKSNLENDHKNALKIFYSKTEVIHNDDLTFIV